MQRHLAIDGSGNSVIKFDQQFMACRFVEGDGAGSISEFDCLSWRSSMTFDVYEWNDDATYALRPHKLVTWTIGTWPLLKNGIFANARLSLAVLLQIGMLTCLLLETRQGCASADTIIDYAALFLAGSSGLTKVYTIKTRKAHLAGILCSALKDWTTDRRPTMKETMRRYARTGIMVFRLELYFTVMVIMSMILDTIPLPDSSQSKEMIESAREVPMKMNCLFTNISTPLYWTVYVIQTAQLINCALFNVGNDVFFFAVAMYLSGEFEVLRILYTEIGTDGEDERGCEEGLGKLVRRHSRLVKMARQLGNAYSAALTMVLLCNALHICLAGVQFIMSLRNNDLFSLVKCVTSFCVVSGQLYLYSYAGDYLMTRNQKLCDGVYECPWYEFCPRIGKDLVFVMMKANTPYYLTAGKVYPMNMESFKNIMKASFSYFSVLQIMFDE